MYVAGIRGFHEVRGFEARHGFGCTLIFPDAVLSESPGRGVLSSAALRLQVLSHNNRPMRTL